MNYDKFVYLPEEFLIKFLLSAVSESLDELVSAIAYKLGTENEKGNVNLLVRVWALTLSFVYLVL